MEDKELEAKGQKKPGQVKNAQAKEPEVIIYSTPSCQYCSAAKSFFKEKGIKFMDYDVTSDRERAREMITKTQQDGVPVIQIDGRMIVGFDRKLIEETLKKKPLTKKEDALNNLFFDLFGSG